VAGTPSVIASITTGWRIVAAGPDESVMQSNADMDIRVTATDPSFDGTAG